MRDIQAIIVGPPGTPYELGFYEVISPQPWQHEVWSTLILMTVLDQSPRR